MLKVNTEALRAAAHECKVCANQLAIAAECHREVSRWEPGPNGPSHEEFAAGLQRRLEDVSTMLSGAGHALADAADRYDAANLDAVRLLSPRARS